MTVAVDNYFFGLRYSMILSGRQRWNPSR